MILKADLHIHCSEDPDDSISYSARELIDIAEAKGFNVLSFTCHNYILYNGRLREYAESKGITLIRGVELTVEHKHVLLYNFTQSEMKKIRKIADIAKYKDSTKLVVAPHPFFIKENCLGSLLIKHISLFDAIELSSFYTGFLNLNKKAIKLASEHNLPLIATSDSHFLMQFGNSYSLISADTKSPESIISAIRERKARPVQKPLSALGFFKLLLRML